MTFGRIEAQAFPASPAYRVERQVDMSPQPPVVHQPLPAVTDPGDADPVPDREVREDLQQDRVRQVGKSRHHPADTHFRFRPEGLGDSF